MNIGELCSRDLVDAPSDTPLLKVAQLMRNEHVGIVVITKAPVVTKSGRLVGMVSTDDLFAHVAGELAGLARLLQRQPGQERFAARNVVETRQSRRPGAGHGN